MEQNTDRMWWTIGAVVLGGILIAGAILLLNTTLLPNIKTKVNDLDRSAVTIPNSNLLDGTKDFSGNWDRATGWENDGTYKGLTVKKKTGQWNGINKTFTAPKDGTYTFSAYIKASGATTSIIRYREINGVGNTEYLKDSLGNNFDWCVDTVTVSLKAGQTALFRYEIASNNADSILWTAGHKWEEGSTATPWMLSASEVGF